MIISHFAVNFGFWSECSNRVNNNNINCPSSNHCFTNIKCLFTIVRLRNIEFSTINTKFLSIDWVKCVFCINKSSCSSQFLSFCQNMQRNCCFTRRFWSINLNDSSSWNSPNSECIIKCQTSSWNNLDWFNFLFSKFHDCALAKLFFNLQDCSIKKFFLIVHFSPQINLVLLYSFFIKMKIILS